MDWNLRWTGEVETNVGAAVLRSSTVGSGSETLELLSLGEPEPTHRPPLLFVHGAYSGAWVWEPHFMPWFAAKGWACHAMSLRGHGKSTGRKRVEEFGIRDFVDDVLAVIATFDEPPVLIGHSLGALVAQYCLARAPLAGLALLAAVPPTGMAAVNSWLALTDPLLCFHMAGIASFGKRWIAPEANVEALFAGPVTETQWTFLKRRYQRESSRALIEAQLPSPVPSAMAGRTPTLVIAPARDRLIPAETGRFTALYHGGSYVLVPGLGHALMLDQGWEGAAEPLHTWLGGLV
jgi:pimeloyl-ACP methyl ester carboxylesterase